MGQVVKLRINKGTGSNGKGTGYHVGLPANIGHLLEDAKITAFEVFMNEEGIVLHPTREDAPEIEEVPSWLQPTTKD